MIEKFSDFWPKNFKKFSKLLSACPEEQFAAWFFFFKFWTVLDFLQKPLAWFSKFCLRVQSKNCGKNSFFCFLFRLFSIFDRKIFRLLAKKLQEVVKTTFFVSRRTICDLNLFLKFWTVLDFLQKHLAWFSKFYLSVQRKICGRNIFLTFLFRIFSEFERNIFRLLAKKLQEVVKTTFPVCRRTIFVWKIFLKIFDPFWIFCRNLWHGSQNSIYVSRVKKCGRIIIFSLFRNFFEIWPKIFRIFGQKTSRSCQSYLLRVQRNNLWP